MDRIVDRTQLAALGARLRTEGRRIVFTNGCFDLLHVGHTTYLEQARALGDVLVVGLNTDASVRRLKGASRPVVSEGDRAQLLTALRCVDYVTLFDELTPVETISALRPDLHVKGGDYDVERLPETPVVRSYGGEVRILPLVPGRSTTSLVERLRESDADSASRSVGPAVAVIPARYASSRFPGKPLAQIAGKTMIEHVYRRTLLAKSLAGVYVATDDERIAAAVHSFGGQVIMTRDDHPTGTDRIAEAARGLNAEIIVNVQGDEPMLDPEEIDALLRPFQAPGGEQVVMSTVATPIASAQDVQDPGVVKVVVDRNDRALYFSRLPVPYYRAGGEGEAHYKHIGLYAYRRSFLFTYAALEPTPLEQAERLEQLRALEHGYEIHVAITAHDAVSVDTPEDLVRVCAIMERC